MKIAQPIEPWPSSHRTAGSQTSGGPHRDQRHHEGHESQQQSAGNTGDPEAEPVQDTLCQRRPEYAMDDTRHRRSGDIDKPMNPLTGNLFARRRQPPHDLLPAAIEKERDEHAEAKLQYAGAQLRADGQREFGRRPGELPQRGEQIAFAGGYRFPVFHDHGTGHRYPVEPGRWCRHPVVENGPDHPGQVRDVVGQCRDHHGEWGDQDQGDQSRHQRGRQGPPAQ